MSLINYIKSMFPSTPRSPRRMHAELLQSFEAQRQRLDDLYRRLEVADRGINGNIDFKFDSLLLPKVQDILTTVDAHDVHMKMFAWEAYRHEGESLEDAKKRFFRSIPKATGGARMLQLGCAKLLEEFHALCEEHGLSYWLAFGTLLGAVRQGGFIPWDDDVDLGMMRDDLKRLVSIVSQEYDRYRITLIYDKNVYCRQVRFWYADVDIPCFLDIFIYDWTPTPSTETVLSLRELRKGMIQSIEDDEEMSFWGDEVWYPSDREQGALIQKYFDRCVSSAKSMRLVCDKDNARGVVYAVDNMDGDSQEAWAYDLATVFPLTQMKFENVQLNVPRDFEVVLRSQYGDYLDLPKDIRTHYQHVDPASLSNAKVLQLIERALAE